MRITQLRQADLNLLVVFTAVQFVPPHGDTFEAIERGRLDLVLNAGDGHTPNRFHRE